MIWKLATGTVLGVMVVLMVMVLSRPASGAVTKPIPPGYRCGPVWLKCYKPGTAPRPPVKVPAPVRTGGTR